jgi:hypothetical protein
LRLIRPRQTTFPMVGGFHAGFVRCQPVCRVYWSIYSVYWFIYSAPPD